MTLALVTGANGFLGRAVAVELVRAGYAVRGLSRNPHSDWPPNGVEPFYGDIREPETIRPAFEDVQLVVHTAAVSGIWGPRRVFHESNVLGTQNVLECCGRAGVRQLVYTSSPSVTFTGEDQENVDESAPYAEKFLCHYPHTKALAEKEVLASNDSEGLLTCALRPHLIWGPGDRHLVPRLISRARAGQLRCVGDGRNRIDITYVENAAVAHRLAAEKLAPGSPVAGSAYFISDGNPVSCWGFINDVLERAGLPAVRKRIGFAAAYSIGAVLEGLHRNWLPAREPRMTRFLASQLAKHHYFDISRARRELGYDPPVSYQEGLARLADALPA